MVQVGMTLCHDVDALQATKLMRKGYPIHCMLLELKYLAFLFTLFGICPSQ